MSQTHNPNFWQSGNLSWLSPAYMSVARHNWCSLFLHWVSLAFSLALASAGNSRAASMAMIAMTTSNSIRVKPRARNLHKPGVLRLVHLLTISRIICSSRT